MGNGEERMIDMSQLGTFGAPLVGSVGLGAVTGYAIKKVLKIAAVVIGLFIAALAFLEYQRVISVDWNVATNGANNILSYLYAQIAPIMNQAGGHINAVAGVVGGGFAAGFMIGFMKG